MQLAELNELPVSQAYPLLESCCAAPNWISEMLEARPFSSSEQLKKTAINIWQQLSEADFLAAFAAHPKIGNIASLQARFAQTGELAADEQSGMQQADDFLIYEMARLNQRYLEKFGFIFIVCATGKSAQQMLLILMTRINNDRTDEIQIAAAEQASITALRLDKLLEADR